MTRSGGGQPTAHEAKHRIGDLIGREATPRAIPLDERVDEAEREAFCQTGVEVGAQASFGKRKLEELPQLGVKGQDLYSIKGTPPNLFVELCGDAFAARNPSALAIDFVERPPYFDITETHKARTWLLDPRAPKVEPPVHIQNLRTQHKGGERSGR